MRISDWSSDVCSSDLVLDDMLKIFADIPDRCAVLFRTCQNRIIEQTLLSSVGQYLFKHLAVPFLVGTQRLDHYIIRLVGRERSETRRVGKGCVRPCRSRWWPYH